MLAAPLLAAGLVVAASRGTAPADPPAPVDRPALEVAAYLVPWDVERGLASLEAASGVLTTVSPVWYTPADDGGVVPNHDESSPEAAAVVAAARAAGLALVPSVSSFRDGAWDAALVSRLVGDPVLRERHADALTALAVQRGWDGLDVDYEALPVEDRDAFSAFVGELGQRLHAHGKQLTVAVHASTDDSPTAFGAGHDLAAIAGAADEVRLMAYDHAWSTSPPGPVAPPAWVDAVVRHALERVPAEQLVLGLGTHGYDWVGSSGRDLTAQDAVALAAREGVPVRRDPASGSARFAYADDAGVEHEVWFEDAAGLAGGLAIARRHGLAGVFVWRLGGEDPAVWPTVQEAVGDVRG